MTPEETQICPLITPYTRQFGLPDELLAKLFHLRKWDPAVDGDVPFKWPSKLRKTVWNPLKNQDTGVPFVPKQYQLVGAHHMGRMPRFMLGDAVGLGKTISAIIACTWLADRLPKLKVVLMATKSTVFQWSEEIQRFSTLRPKVMEDSYKGSTGYPARFKQLIDFFENDDHEILICKYTSMIGQRRQIEGRFDSEGNPTVGGKERFSQEALMFQDISKKYGKDAVLILDECQKIKSVGANTRTLIQLIQKHYTRVWAMSATIVKNAITEFYSISSAIGVRPLGSYSDFCNDYCIWRDVFVGGGRYKKTLEGYTDIAKIKQALRPFYLGRSQKQVKEKLPILSTQVHDIDLDTYQKKLLLEDIPSGKFPLPPAVMKVAGEILLKERDVENQMTLLSVYSLVANHPCLLDPTDKKNFFTPKLSPKEVALLDMLDGEYKGEKIVCYTKSRTWIDRLEELTKRGQFTERKFLRITGAENDKQRHEAKMLFQDPNGMHDLIVINSAATEGINLQQAANLIALDLPWSWGDTLQLIGRICRLGSPNSTNTFHAFVARGSVDEYVIETLMSKKGVFEMMFGNSHSAGILDNTGESFDIYSGMEAASDNAFLDAMRIHAKDAGMRTFISGEQLLAEGANPDRQMIFEKRKGKKSSQKITKSDELDLKWFI